MSVPARVIKNINIGITCDNYVGEIYCNSKKLSLGSGYNNWKTPDFYDVDFIPMVIAVYAYNADTTSPAGLLIRVKIGNSIVFRGLTPRMIKCTYSTGSTPPPDDADGRPWYHPFYDDSGWKDIELLAQYGKGPWGTRVSGWDDPLAWWFWALSEAISDTPNSQYTWYRIYLRKKPERVLPV